MVYYDATQVKLILGESGTTNDAKIQLYGDMADALINSYILNVETTIPIAAPSAQLKKISTLLTVGYFYKFESGDTLTAEQAERIWDEYFKNKYRRPEFFTTRGT